MRTLAQVLVIVLLIVIGGVALTYTSVRRAQEEAHRAIHEVERAHRDAMERVEQVKEENRASGGDNVELSRPLLAGDAGEPYYAPDRAPSDGHDDDHGNDHEHDDDFGGGEVGELRQENAALRAEVDELQAMLADMNATLDALIEDQG